MFRLSRLFVVRPCLALVAALLLALLGAAAFALLPVRLYPSLAPTQINVSCTYPGANSREVMNTVAGPIENQVNGVEDMLYMSSSCADSGAYSLTISFELGTDRDFAAMKVQNLVQQALSLLPQEVKNTGVTVASGSSEHIGMLMLRAPGGRLSADQIADFAHGIVQPALLRVPGVAKASVSEEKIAMRVWLDPQRLAALGLTAADVVAAVKDQNVQASLGSVGASPTDDPSARLLTLIARGRLNDARQFDAIVIRTASDGSLVRLGDLGRTEYGRQAYGKSTRYNDEPSAKITITQLPGADAMRTMAKIKSEMKALERTFPEGLAWEMSYDTSRILVATLKNFARYALILFALAVAVAALRLRSIRGAAVVAVALPLALAPAYAALLATDGSLNAFSTLAGLLATALVLADASAVVSRILRLRAERGLSACEAAAAAMEALATPIAVSSLALFALFAPFHFVSGFKGAVYRPFAAILAAAALLSGFVALTVVPALAARLLGGRVRPAAPRPSRAAPSAALRCAVVLLAALATAVLVRSLPSGLVPDEDTGVFYLDCNTAEGTSLPTTEKICARAVAALRRLPGVDKVLTVCGSSDIGGTGENQGVMQVILKDWSERKGEGLSQKETMAAAVRATEDFAGAKLRAYADPTVPGLSTFDGVCVNIYATAEQDPVKLANEAHRLEALMAKSPLADLVVCGYTADSPYLRLAVDREKCEMLGVGVSTLYSTLQQYLGSTYVNDVNLGVQVNRVTLEARGAGRVDREAVARLFVRSDKGDMVPVGSLVTFAEELGPRVCYRYNQYVYCSISMVPKPGVSTGEAIAECERIVRANIAPGFAYCWGGQTFHETRAKGNGPVLVVLALLLTYLILVGYFESLRRPLAVFAPAVVAAAGGLLALAVGGGTVTLYAQMALLALGGVAVKFGVFAQAGAPDRRAVTAALGGFALGVLPCVFAAGVGLNALRAISLAAFGAAVFACAIWYNKKS